MSHGPSPVPLTGAWSGPAAQWRFREGAFTPLPQYASPSPTASLFFVFTTVCSGSSNHVSFGVPSGCGHLRYVPLRWERGDEGGPWLVSLPQLTYSSFIIQVLTEHLLCAWHCPRNRDTAMNKQDRQLSQPHGIKEHCPRGTEDF